MVEALPISLSHTTHILEQSRSVATAPAVVQTIVTLLEKSLFVKASELVEKVTVAAKDANGRVRWLTGHP